MASRAARSPHRPTPVAARVAAALLLTAALGACAQGGASPAASTTTTAPAAPLTVDAPVPTPFEARAQVALPGA